MKTIILLALVVAATCCESVEGINCFPSPDCSISATVRQTRMASPCDVAFELEDGSYIIPERRQYIQPPSPTEDPIYHFDLQPGARVKIGGRLSNQTCASGRVLFITCIELIQQPAQ